ncbi:DUF2894 domain-containing protein [Ideonella sp. BN130291]|uniref:DUF2894 domain-containing protein n=1 Tax=Ideonella sp. BN130291 TaxID=3112940 RepID=UPI002E26EEDE|nr:DUF2894 domain-containing protein [Ideonella sp. BN130291]
MTAAAAQGADASAGDAEHGLEASLAQARERGDHTFDPVRFRVIEAMARRAAGRDGAARRIVHRKAMQLLAAYVQDLCQANVAADQAPGPAPGGDRSALRQLVDRLARPAPAGAAPELQAMKQFRGTWARLKAEQRLTQSLAKVPANAGPLNSHHLVHRSLTLMKALSPEYLHVFMAHADALLWLEQATLPAPARAHDTPARASGGRKPQRGRG